MLMTLREAAEKHNQHLNTIRKAASRGDLRTRMRYGVRVTSDAWVKQYFKKSRKRKDDGRLTYGK